MANVGEQSFGVKKYSLILDYDFDPINNTPQDIMHVLHEGVARKLVMIFFGIWVSEKRCTISEINYRLKKFSWGYTHEKNKIRRISANDLKKKNFIVSASQMHTFILLFPIIFVDILDTSSDEYM